MGRPFTELVDDDDAARFACIHCGAEVSSGKWLQWAGSCENRLCYLFSSTTSIVVTSEPHAISGPTGHSIAQDLGCLNCSAFLGWRYVELQQQDHDEGSFIVQAALRLLASRNSTRAARQLIQSSGSSAAMNPNPTNLSGPQPSAGSSNQLIPQQPQQPQHGAGSPHSDAGTDDEEGDLGHAILKLYLAQQRNLVPGQGPAQEDEVLPSYSLTVGSHSRAPGPSQSSGSAQAFPHVVQAPAHAAVPAVAFAAKPLEQSAPNPAKRVLLKGPGTSHSAHNRKTKAAGKVRQHLHSLMPRYETSYPDLLCNDFYHKWPHGHTLPASTLEQQQVSSMTHLPGGLHDMDVRWDVPGAALLTPPPAWPSQQSGDLTRPNDGVTMKELLEVIEDMAGPAGLSDCCITPAPLAQATRSALCKAPTRPKSHPPDSLLGPHCEPGQAKSAPRAPVQLSVVPTPAAPPITGTNLFMCSTSEAVMEEVGSTDTGLKYNVKWSSEEQPAAPVNQTLLAPTYTNSMAWINAATGQHITSNFTASLGTAAPARGRCQPPLVVVSQTTVAPVFGQQPQEDKPHIHTAAGAAAHSKLESQASQPVDGDGECQSVPVSVRAVTMSGSPHKPAGSQHTVEEDVEAASTALMSDMSSDGCLVTSVVLAEPPADVPNMPPGCEQEAPDVWDRVPQQKKREEQDEPELACNSLQGPAEGTQLYPANSLRATLLRMQLQGQTSDKR